VEFSEAQIRSARERLQRDVKVISGQLKRKKDALKAMENSFGQGNAKPILVKLQLR